MISSSLSTCCEHLVEQEAAARNLRNHLAPGGRFFFHLPTVREKPVLFSSRLTSFHAWAELAHVARDRRAEEFAAVVQQAGLTIERTTRTFGRYTGGLAVSLFCLSHHNTLKNRILQALLAPICRLAAWADLLELDRPWYAMAVMGGIRD